MQVILLVATVACLALASSAVEFGLQGMPAFGSSRNVHSDNTEQRMNGDGSSVQELQLKDVAALMEELTQRDQAIRASVLTRLVHSLRASPDQLLSLSRDRLTELYAELSAELGFPLSNTEASAFLFHENQ